MGKFPNPPATFPCVIMLPQLQILSSLALPVGCADLKIDKFAELQGALQNSGPLEDINLTTPFPFSVIEYQNNRWRAGENEWQFHLQQVGIGFVEKGRVKISKFQDF